jgi:hypothetical protein
MFLDISKCAVSHISLPALSPLFPSLSVRVGCTQATLIRDAQSPHWHQPSEGHKCVLVPQLRHMRNAHSTLEWSGNSAYPSDCHGNSHQKSLGGSSELNGSSAGPLALYVLYNGVDNILNCVLCGLLHPPYV